MKVTGINSPSLQWPDTFWSCSIQRLAEPFGVFYPSCSTACSSSRFVWKCRWLLTMFFNRAQTFSSAVISGDYAGQFINCIPFLTNHSFTICALGIEALFCWLVFLAICFNFVRDKSTNDDSQPCPGLPYCWSKNFAPSRISSQRPWYQAFFSLHFAPVKLCHTCLLQGKSKYYCPLR